MGQKVRFAVLFVSFIAAMAFTLHRWQSMQGDAAEIEFAGTVTAINNTATGNMRVTVESEYIEAEVMIPNSEMGFLRVGDIMVKEAGHQKPALFRGGSQQVPSAYWRSEPVEDLDLDALTYNPAAR